MLKLNYKMEGLESVLRALRAAKKSIKHLRRGMLKATRVIAKKAKENAKKLNTSKGHESHRLLWKSIGAKVTNNGETVIGLVGPRYGFAKKVGVRKRGGKKSNVGDAIIEDPVRFAHAVEFGHGGPHPAPAHPFMRPAYEQCKEEAQRIIANELAIGLVLEMGKK